MSLTVQFSLDLYQTLLDYDKLGYKVDARLMNFAWGLECAKRYKL